MLEVPEWGGMWVRVVGLNGKERDQFEASMATENGRPQDPEAMDLENIRAKLVVLSVKDAQGERLFQWPQDVELVGGRSAAALDRIFTVARRLSGLRQGEIEGMVKNFEPGPVGDSSSG
jgi:hypothetical protein